MLNNDEISRNICNVVINIWDNEICKILIKDNYIKLYKSQGYLFGHYFRNQYYLLKKIDNSILEKDKKIELAKLY